MEEAEISFRRNSSPVNPVDAVARFSTRDAVKPLPTVTLTSAEDSDLLALVGQGDETAMAALFDRYSRLVYSVALRVLRDPATAEDVLQEVFMLIWRKPEALATGRGSVGAWLAVVARNRSVDSLRRRKPSDAVEDVILIASGDLAQETERNSMVDRAREVVQMFPFEQRKTLEVAFFDGLTHAEIAESAGDSLETVKTRIRTALLVLRKAMQA